MSARLIKLGAPACVGPDFMPTLTGCLLHELANQFDHSPLGPPRPLVRVLPHRKLLQALGFELGRRRFYADLGNRTSRRCRDPRFLDYLGDISQMDDAAFENEVTEALAAAQARQLTLSSFGGIRTENGGILDDRWFYGDERLVEFANRILALALPAAHGFMAEPLARFIRHSDAEVILTDTTVLCRVGWGFWIEPHASPFAASQPPDGYGLVPAAGLQVPDITDEIMIQLERYSWYRRLAKPA